MTNAQANDTDPYADLTRDQLVQIGLLEGENYRDFPPADDCYPEDGWE